MNHGKSICNELKAVRRRIADENDIPLQQEECHYEGECEGTCPHCEAELKYIEDSLASRISKGNVAKVAGLALCLAACSPQQDFPFSGPSKRLEGKPAVRIDTITVKGRLQDGRTKEPMPFGSVVFRRDSMTVESVMADVEGHFELTLPRGEYDMEVALPGYIPYLKTVMVSPADSIDTIELDPVLQVPEPLMGIVPVKVKDPDDSTQQMEVEGVKVRVQ